MQIHIHNYPLEPNADPLRTKADIANSQHDELLAAISANTAAVANIPQPIVNFTAPELNIPATVVNVAPSPAPAVTFEHHDAPVTTTAPDVHVHIPPPGKKVITRDRMGNISGIEPA